jgi:glycosyltransferase involved in cell wall biosynthesis
MTPAASPPREGSKLSVVLLTFNSAGSIQRTLDAVRQISDDIHAVDSFSTDDTVAILVRNGVSVAQRSFANYSDQRNWAIDNLRLRYGWQMHVDADEELGPELLAAIRAIDFSATQADGYIVGRKIVFMGRLLRFGGISTTWHCRIFRAGHGRCEDRLYDQHFVCSGRIETIGACMLDHQELSLSDWTARHNRWSDTESAEALRGPAPSEGQIRPNLAGTRIERARALKRLYYRGPLLIRAFIYFLYRYIALLGFLDGREGLIYSVLQGFWFRFLVDAKILEARRRRSAVR